MKDARIHVFCGLDVTPLLLLLLVWLNVLCAAVCLLCETCLGVFGHSLRLGPFFFFFFFFCMLDHMLCTYVSPAPVISLPGELSMQTVQPKKISGWPLEYWAVELSWEIWFKWVALISCGNLLGTREKKIFWRSVFKFIIWETLFSPCNKNLRDSVKGCDEGGGLLCLEIQRVWNATGVDRWACAQMRFRSVW